MPIPDFIVSLRQKVGTELLWVPGVTAVVLRHAEDGMREVLLVQRADNGAWTPVTGIIDPGEQPAVAGAREVLEEADVVAVAEALVRVQALEPMVYDNGDQAQYLDLTFRFRYISGEPFPADGENTAAAWFPLDELPPMSDDMLARLHAATDGGPSAEFSV